MSWLNGIDFSNLGSFGDPPSDKPDTSIDLNEAQGGAFFKPWTVQIARSIAVPDKIELDDAPPVRPGVLMDAGFLSQKTTPGSNIKLNYPNQNYQKQNYSLPSSSDYSLISDDEKKPMSTSDAISKIKSIWSSPVKSPTPAPAAAKSDAMVAAVKTGTVAAAAAISPPSTVSSERVAVPVVTQQDANSVARANAPNATPQQQQVAATIIYQQAKRGRRKFFVPKKSSSSMLPWVIGAGAIGILAIVVAIQSRD